MPYPSDPDTLVLLGLRLRSFAPAEVVAETAGLPLDDVAARLVGFAERGLAAFREGRMTGWMLTPDGRTEGERLLAAEVEGLGLRDAVAAAYLRFLAVNQRMLDICTDWQLREVDGAQVVNQHDDPLYDAVVVDSLVTIDSVIQPVLADLAEALERLGGYGPRLASALAKVQGGDGEWFTKPTIDSYHTVWFELHENLLATLGIERGSERTTPPEEAPR
ncbi:MAG TPA: hypothetical protein VIJ47_14350 [Acidimicrobiales bacterium]